MGLFDKWFGSSSSKKDNQPNIRFGRYSDSYKSPEQLDFWDKANKQFDKKEFLDSYESFFTYLGDKKEENVTFNREGDTLNFELLQGSKKITGSANNEFVKASTSVVKSDRLNVGFMRRLIEQNYAFKYAKFCLNDKDEVTMKFNSYTIDGSPYKLYYALKEMAINSDKQDDLLANEFEMLHQIDTDHTKEIPASEKQIKYKHTQKWIAETLTKIDGMDSTKYAGGITFLLLYLIYKLDYLIQPEGFMMESLEKCHNIYFTRDNKTSEQKSIELIKELKKIQERTEEELSKELYKVKSTFGITTPSGHEQVAGAIDSELPKMDWYKDNDYPEVAVSIPGYVAGYNLFNFAVLQPDREYFHMLIEILESEYFKELGIDNGYVNDKGQLEKGNIREEIHAIAKSNTKKYPKLAPNTKELRFDNLPEFAKSFMLMVKVLDLKPAEKKA